LSLSHIRLRTSFASLRNNKMISTTSMPRNHLTHKPMCSSIMDHRIPAQQVEIQGYYWPRILRPDPELRSSLVGNKKESKKVHKATTGMSSIPKNSMKKITTTARVPCKELASNSLLEVLRDLPFLIPSEYHQGRYSPRSPITGKLFSSTTYATTSNNRNSVGRSRLVPTKPIRKNVLDRKLQSRTTP
jgi:hypothetical protein